MTDRSWSLLLMLVAGLVGDAAGQESFRLPESIRQQVMDELQMKTLGGRQFWGDVQFFHRWRIQRNVFTGHYRLLDEHDWRHATGTLEECQAKLAAIRAERQLPPMSGKGVVLLHGVIRSSKSIYTVADRLRQDGFAAFPTEYPSTQISIPEAAEQLDSVIRQLDGIEEISLVGHSMGGLVIRAWFAAHSDPRVRRVVMMGTPNHGAEMADLMCRNFLYRTIFGPAGRQLVTDRQGLIATLPAPRCEFGIIAGARGTPGGWNPLIPGDDDGTVTVTSTRLAGASDFYTVPVLHHAILGHEDTSRAVSHFFTTGKFRESGDAQPIPLSEPQEPATPSAPSTTPMR